MKMCQFCAEEIQDAAIVCKHCGREQSATVSSPFVAPPSAKRKTSPLTWFFAIVLGLFLIGLVSSLSSPTAPNNAGGTAPAKPQPVTSAVPAEPDEPCVVQAPAAARAAAQNWCQGGVFTKVNVSTDANNFVVMLQYSNKGLRTWQSNKGQTLNRFRRVTDEMVEQTDMNVAFSLHDTNGDLLGGCTRFRGARESTCKGR